MSIIDELIHGEISQREACRLLQINRTTLATLLLNYIKGDIVHAERKKPIGEFDQKEFVRNLKR